MPDPQPVADIEFTGEFYVPGKTSPRIAEDHLQRYRFAAAWVAGKSVLDIACGTGYAAPILLGAGAASYHGVDIQQRLVRSAQQQYGCDRASYACGDVTQFAPDRRFDVITCFETIEHVSQYRQALGNLYRLLERDGVLIVSSPNRIVTSPNAKTLDSPPENSFHTQEFTPPELLHELAAAGFKLKTPPGSLYGQRQRWHPRSPALRRIRRAVFGPPDQTTSAVVAPVRRKTPRYFLVVATT